MKGINNLGSNIATKLKVLSSSINREDAERASETLSNHKLAISSDRRNDLTRRRLGIKKGKAIASPNVNGTRSHFDEIKFFFS